MKCRSNCVIFNNILQSAFSFESVLCSIYLPIVVVCDFRSKEISAKAAHEMYNVAEIDYRGIGVNFSNIIQNQLFSTKVFCEAFSHLQFVFAIFWSKNISVKVDQKMLVKLSLGCLQRPTVD